MSAFRAGVAGPVGSGKTALVDALCKAMGQTYNIVRLSRMIFIPKRMLSS